MAPDTIKHMELDKTYEPSKYEATIYKSWEEAGAFTPAGKGEPFCIIMPPPNANGELHAGHAVGYTLEDVITRFKRMQGYRALWLPGTDHAGIETQYVFERDVLAPQSLSRFDLGPEKFYTQLMEFIKAKQGNIISQFKSMGFSADWSKLKFTLEDDIVDIVYDTFIKLHEDGHIYRGNRIVNWCPRCNAAFADIEVKHVDRQDKMYTLDYGSLKIATVRPETIFADVAVAVNPKDSRYKELIGKEATIPIINRSVPIIADVRVDPKAGTGALKVTPGHDPTDYEIGIKHKLPEISVIDFEGKLINVPEEFAGLDVGSARSKVATTLQTSGKLVEAVEITHAVGVHDRCDSIIEPLISEQWFLRVKDLNKPVIKALESEDIQIFPARYKKIALDWLAQEHDWCISRQIWWGIRIPVYYHTGQGKNKKPYLIAKSEAEAKEYYGAGNYRAETDTFDTWFSSGQWPYATLMTTGGFEDFYPSTLMGTAREILHKWVTRMIMFGIYKTGEVPFKHIYLWGLVTDAKGQKMSKSKGNVIDPLAMTAKYGTDALRLAGSLSNTPGTDSPLSEDRIITGRNFCNKLWNVSRYVLSTLKDSYPDAEPKPKTTYDEWLLTRLDTAGRQITAQLEKYRLNEASNLAYHLLWDDFADWYIEISKHNPSPQVLAYGFETILKLLHPFIPFITEAIWGQLPARQSQLISAPWPKRHKSYPKATAEIEQVKAVIGEVRALKTRLDLTDVPLYYTKSQLVSDYKDIIQKLAGLSKISQVKDGRGLPLLSTGNRGWLGIEASVMKDYAQKLDQSLKEALVYKQSLETKLSNPKFTGSAPKEVVDDSKQRLKDAETKIAHLQDQARQLKI